MAEHQYLIGFDVGTTAVKGGIFDTEGNILAHASRQYPTVRSQHCRVEQDPEDWVRATKDILAELLHGRQVRNIMSFGLCSQVNTHVFVDANGKALLPAIVWQDGRASSEAEEIDRQVNQEQKEDWWGMPMPIDASHVLSRMAWVARHCPKLWEKTRWVLSPKDYCLLHITGRVTADPISSFGLVDRTGDYITSLVKLVPGAAERLPPLVPHDVVVGTSRYFGIEGFDAPVVAGTMDAWGNLFGSGVVKVGEGAYFSGTSETITLVSSQHVATPGVVSFLPVNGWHVHAGPTQSGGDSLRWLADCHGRNIKEVVTAAESADRHRQRLFFLPHLQGERAPLWDPYSRGTFLGIEPETGLAEMALAVMEGVACSARLLFESVSKASGCTYKSLYMGGGGSRSDFWNQIRADMLDVEIRRLAFLDTGVLGSAIMAGLGTGLFPSIAVAAQQMVRVERNFTPNPGYRQRYDDLTAYYCEAYLALKALYRRMNG